MLRQALTGLTILLAIALPGAGQAGSAAPSPDAVRVVRSPGLSDLAALDVTIRDGQRAAGLYHDLVGLPAPAAGAYSCPNDLDVVYHLTFTRHGSSVLQADVQATGCRFASLRPGGGRMAYGERAFWDPLAGALRVPAPDLFPAVSGR